MGVEELMGELKYFIEVYKSESYLINEPCIDMAYPSSIDAFIIKITVEKEWAESVSNWERLLMNILKKTTTVKTYKNIHLLVIYIFGTTKKRALVNPSLTYEQIKKLCFSKNYYIHQLTEECVKHGNLSNRQIKQICRILDDGYCVDSCDKEIIILLMERYWTNYDFRCFINKNSFKKLRLLSNNL